jgi:hypothetical protein
MVRLRRSTRTLSGSRTHAREMPATARCTTAGAPRVAKESRRLRAVLMNSRAQDSASGTSSRAARARGDRCRAGRWSSSLSTASLRRMPTATARWLVIDTTGRAVMAASRAIHTSIRGSSLFRPTTEGTSCTRSWRARSPRRSLTSRAIAASNGCVHLGWSDHFSPARKDAISMKHAPLRGLRCRPGESVGMKSGVPFRFVMGPAPGPRVGPFPVCDRSRGCARRNTGHFPSLRVRHLADSGTQCDVPLLTPGPSSATEAPSPGDPVVQKT